MTLELTLFDAFYPPIILSQTSREFSSAHDAALFCIDPANHPADELFNKVRSKWLNGPTYRLWQSAMPASTPTKLREHQKNPSKCDAAETSGLIEKMGRPLSLGQTLFHAGRWKKNSLTTSKPLSTSLSPEPAIINALWKGKAHKSGYLDLWVLTAIDPPPTAFVYKHRGNVRFKQELEVILPMGVTLTEISVRTISTSFPSEDEHFTKKTLTARVIEIEMRQ